MGKKIWLLIHPGNFGSDVMVTWPYVHPTARVPVRPHHRETTVYSRTFYLVWEPRRKLIAHQCYDELTAVKAGEPLTIIT